MGIGAPHKLRFVIERDEKGGRFATDSIGVKGFDQISVCHLIFQSLPLPRGLFQILPHHDAPNRLTGVLHFLSVCASGSRRGVLGNKAAVPLQHGVA